MADEATLEAQAGKGRKAKLVMESLEEAFEALEKDCFETFANSEIHDSEGHQACRIYMKVLADVKNRFRQAVINGDAASKELIRIHNGKEGGKT